VASGRATRETIAARAGRVVSSGAIYTTLGRLEERGLVRSWVGEPGSGPGRPRKYYAIEPAGARALMESWSTIAAMAGGLVPKLAELAEG
jgi:DNA-binding PadR family transcriptional regulator